MATPEMPKIDGSVRAFKMSAHLVGCATASAATSMACTLGVLTPVAITFLIATRIALLRSGKYADVMTIVVTTVEQHAHVTDGPTSMHISDILNWRRIA